MVEAITLIILTHILYLVSVFLVLKFRAGGQPKISLRFVICTAILFRLTAWPLYPALSDDAYRYRWEGKLQAAGGDPYQTRPIDARWTEIRDETFPRVGSKDFKSIYGPLVELSERLTYHLLNKFTKNPFVQVCWFKLPGALFDLGILWALVLLLRQHSLPSTLVLIYAWSPLPVMEFWATGHNDSIDIFFILLALLMAARRRWIWAFGWLSLAVAAKIWPILLFPAFILSPAGGKPRWWQWLVLLPVAALPAAPYFGDITENAQFISGFVGGWRNNDSLFGAILWISGGDLYRAKYTAFAITGVITIVFALFVRSLEKAVLWTIVAVLLVSANCHPWYLTWFAPLLVFYPYTPLLLWNALMPLSYAVLIRWLNLDEWDGSTPLRWLVFAPFFACALISSSIRMGSHWLRQRR